MSESGITLKERDAIRFYSGDIRKRDLDGQISESEYSEGFEGIRSAYKTMNCLMFPGIDNEMERIREKKGRLSPLIILEAERTLQIFCDIYRAMYKFSASQMDKKLKKVYRTDRGVSIEELKKGITVSFTSTSLHNNPEAFLLHKSELTFLEILVPPSIPHLDFSGVLGEEYLFSDQKEILLPPFQEVTLAEMELSEQEKTYRDVDGNPPKAKFFVTVDDRCFAREESGNKIEKNLSHARNVEAAGILERMIQGEELNQQEVETYCGWKKDFRGIVAREFQKIKNEFEDKSYSDSFKRKQLTDDVWQMLLSSNKMRKAYKKKLYQCHIVLAVVSLLPIICMAFSFLPQATMVMKILAITSSAVSIFLTRIIKLEAYGAKLTQRTKTYLALCSLHREIVYESDWNKKKTDLYFGKFTEVIKEDTEMSLQNLQRQIESGEALFQDELEV